MTATEWTTLSTAAWGAVTGTVALLLQLAQYYRDRPILRLDASMGVASDIHRPKLRATFTVKAYNAGRRVIRITKVGISIPTSDATLPEGAISQEAALHVFDSDRAGRVIALEEGTSFDFHLDPFPMEIAKSFRKKEEAFVEDMSGKKHKVCFFAITEIPESLDESQSPDQMNKKATLLLPTGIEMDLEDFDLNLGGLIQLAQDALDDPSITPEGFGALKHFFFVNSSTGSLIDSLLDLQRPLSTLLIGDGHVVELRLCTPSPEPDGTVLNPMRGVTIFVK